MFYLNICELQPHAYSMREQARVRMKKKRMDWEFIFFWEKSELNGATTIFCLFDSDADGITREDIFDEFGPFDEANGS